MDPTDATLIEEYLAGDEAAVATVDRWIVTTSRSFARRLGESWDDVVQDARLEVYRLLRDGRFRGGSRLSTYLWRVVANTCLDAIRARQRQRWVDLAESPELAALARQRAQRHSFATETTDLVLRVLEEVPAHCKEIWRMILHGWSYQEMSQELEVPAGTIRVRALRCRKQAHEIRERLAAGAGAVSGEIRAGSRQGGNKSGLDSPNKSEG